MPYIVQEKRARLDEVKTQLLQVLKEYQIDDENDNMEGNLNYFFSTILNELYHSNYKDVNAAVGLLECIKLEYYAMLARPYEDSKIKANGNVYTCATVVDTSDS